jgi:hypothetical protein
MKFKGYVHTLGLILSCMTATASVAQVTSSLPTIRVPATAVREVVLDRRPTSGELLLVGQTSDLRASIRNGQQGLAIRGLRGSGTRLCFAIRSSNGFYSATFSVPRPKSETATVSVPLSRIEQGGRLRGVFAIKAFLAQNSSCIQSGPSAYSAWAGESQTSERWLALALPTATSVSLQSSIGVIFPCSNIGDAVGSQRASSTEFQFLCPTGNSARCGTSEEFFVLISSATGPARPSRISVGPTC